MSAHRPQPERRPVRAYPDSAREQGASRRPPSQKWEMLLAGDFSDKHLELLENAIDVPPNSTGVIYFDSNGGSVYTAFALMSLIRMRGLKVTGIVLGECSSSALLPFAACQRRLVPPFSTHLFHAMKWESEENVRLHEAAEWARHFQQIDTQFDQLLAGLFGVSPELLSRWTEPGRFVSGAELVEAGLAESIDPLQPLPAGLLPR